MVGLPCVRVGNCLQIQESLSWQKHQQEKCGSSLTKDGCHLDTKWAAGDLNTRPPLCKSGIITELDQLPASRTSRLT